MTRSLSAIIFLFFLTACSNNKAETSEAAVPPPSAPKYYFYPKANVYFDSVNKDYIFLSADGSLWQSVKQIPAAMQALMDKSVFIDTAAQPVWKNNERHKIIYSALLYASPADTQEVKTVTPLAKEAPKDVKKEKKGIGKFLDKIFGKKKKEEASN